MACDDVGDFLPASWKGFDIHVDSVTYKNGRRIAQHKYPNSERWRNEDLGIETPSLTATAYFAWDQESGAIYADAKDFEKLCREGGVGDLLMPPNIAIRAQCQKCERTFEKDKQDYMAFDLEFLEEDEEFAGAPFTIETPGLAIRQVAQALLDVAGTIMDFASNFFAIVNLVFDIRNAIGDVVSTALAVIDTAASIAAPFLDLAEDIAVLFNQTKTAIEVFENAETDDVPAAYNAMVEAFVQYASAVVDNISQPQVFAESMQRNVVALAAPREVVGLATYVGRTAETAYSQMYVAAMQQANSFSGVICGIVMAQAYADAEYKTRQEAQAARGKMISSINYVLSQLSVQDGSPMPAADSLMAARNYAAQAIASKIATLKPMQDLTFNIRLTAPYIAWRLYRDPLRAQELVDLNNVAHPLFMPSKLEAVAADARSTDSPRKR